MRKTLGPLLLCSLSIACGGDSTSSPTTPVDTRPAKAEITVTPSASQVCLSPLAAFSLRLSVPFTLTERAGLGAKINFVRLRLINGAGTEIERAEVGANAIIAGIGTNVIAANSTNSWRVRFDFNSQAGTASNQWQTFGLIYNFTDDRGNTSETTINALNATATLICT